jgi:hypothetical protein
LQGFGQGHRSNKPVRSPAGGIEGHFILFQHGTTLRALFEWAALLAKEGERGRSVEILAEIADHPSLEHEDKEKAARLTSEIQEGLPSDMIHSRVKTGKRRALERNALEDLVKEILRSGWDK